MPLITGTVWLFGQILSFALPVGLLITFATFFYRQARKAHEATPNTSPASPSSAGTAAAAPPAAPSRPYPDL